MTLRLRRLVHAVHVMHALHVVHAAHAHPVHVMILRRAPRPVLPPCARFRLTFSRPPDLCFDLRFRHTHAGHVPHVVPLMPSACGGGGHACSNQNHREDEHADPRSPRVPSIHNFPRTHYVSRTAGQKAPSRLTSDRLFVVCVKKRPRHARGPRRSRGVKSERG